MSEKTARSHTHVSNRAKARETLEKKAVYKSVLENPFRIKWPSIPMNVQNLFLAHLIAIFDSDSGYRRRRSIQSLERRAKRHRKMSNALVSSGVDASPGDTIMVTPTPQNVVSSSGETEAATVGGSDTIQAASHNSEQELQTSPLQHLTIGINEVTKALEAQISKSRNVVTISENASIIPSDTERSPTIAVVFVCRADIDPPLLVDHIPHLIAACNAPRMNVHVSGPPQHVKLVLLPKGSEHSLAAALGLRRVAILAVHREALLLSSLDDLLKAVPTVSAPWLSSADAPTSSMKQLIPTHIKQVRTTAPKDMKAAKEQRNQAKTAAKKRRLTASVPRGKRETITAHTVSDP
ncbi:hypothetical protein BJ138DRAFT_468458 [Hygrophoropsis aurantiaca]|uniref:Uncharacterized protein n=1 Tax=Hygrophoropsis aurantiaca TaxID=72124 RepID=A0ACB8ASU1_9AGAM|nr:hypothetical protein BJ138DRAFT_468458 [Hygrophoropsis aurantiaca]